MLQHKKKFNIINFKQLERLKNYLMLLDYSKYKSIRLYCFLSSNPDKKIKLDVMEELPQDKGYKIGVIELETYPFNKSEEQIKEEVNNGIYSNSGYQRVYAGGWLLLIYEPCVGYDTHLYYLGEPGCESPHALIKTMIIYIFKSGYDIYTFYAHNFGKFEAHFRINSLLFKIPNFVAGWLSNAMPRFK